MMAWMRPQRRTERERGAAAVEFALVVPFLLLLVFGIISFAFLLTFRQNLSQAAAEGARAAAVQLDDAKRKAAAADGVTEALRTADVTCTSVGALADGAGPVGTCAISAPTACQGDTSHRCITVTLTYDYRDNPMIPTVPLLDLAIPEQVSYASTVRVS